MSNLKILLIQFLYLTQFIEHTPGNQGLQIIFNNTTTMLLIGTKKPEELQAAITKIKTVD